MSAKISRASGDRKTIEFDLDLSEIGRCRDEVSRFLDRHGAGEEVREDLRLAVSELVSNAIKHGPGTSGTIIVVAEPDRFVLDLSDAENIPDPAALSPPVTSEPTGRGLIMVVAVTDEVTFVDDGGKRFIRCIRHR